MQPSMTEWITAIAALVAALATTAYFIATLYIYRETKKSTYAATQAAQAAKDNASAAQKSAGAAESSANAAFQSIHLMREQIEDQADLGKGIVQTTVDSATAAIDNWKNLNIRNLSASQIPDTDDLVPSRADSAVEHARRLSPAAAAKLSSAFDDLRNARRELTVVRSYSAGRPLGQVFSQICDNFEGHLTRAFEKLMDVRKLVP